MEKLMTIQQVMPLSERTYTDKNGNNQVFTSRGLILTDGIDTVYAEMIGDMARATRDTDILAGSTHAVQLQVSTRSWRDAQGGERYSNEVRIVKMG